MDRKTLLVGLILFLLIGAVAAGNDVNHTARVTRIDQQGNLLVLFGFDRPVKDIVHDLKLR